nr:anaphase-promoting complex subunit 5 [Quercus suber]
MPRYLTPSRICLLVLIELYLSNLTSSNDKVEFLSFIAQHVRQPTGQEYESSASDTSSVFIATDASGFATSLGSLASAIPGRSVYDQFLPKLWQLTTLDSLYALFERLANLVPEADSAPESAKGKISRASPLGQYVRRCCLEFTRLQFADSQTLWNAFEAYRQHTHHAWAAKNPDAAAKFAAYHANMTAISYAVESVNLVDSTSETYISTEDTDRLITFSIHHLQKLGNRMPEEAKSTLRQWITDQSDSGLQSLQHFLAFFESWRAGQYTMALEDLHRYFDYSLAAKSGNLRGDESMRVYYQYALLHLSVLHADFDCWSESVDAMEECISTARENQDTACLSFALSWLLYLRQASSQHDPTSFESVGGLVGGTSGGQDEIAFLKSKSKETKNWSLMSSTLLEEAKLEMYANGNNIKFAEQILQSGFSNIQHDLYALMPATLLFQGVGSERSGCRIAYALAHRGQYDSAIHALDDLAPIIRGVLKLEQRVLGFSHDLKAAESQLSQLRIFHSFTDPELGFEIDMIELDFFIEREDFHSALYAVDKHLRCLRTSPGPDVAQRLLLLVCKARVFTAASQPARAFSIALRAASTAHRLLLIPVMLEASTVLAHVLIDLNEFTSCVALVEALLPAVIETNNVRLTAELYALLASAHAGIAGGLPVAQRTKDMSAAEESVEKGHSYYSKLKSLNGVLDCLAMKARIARWRGDEAAAKLADEVSMQHLATIRG